MAEILDLINNLDTVDMLDPGTINLISWEPSLPPHRDTTHTPIYDNGSTLISSQFDNIVETFTLSVAGNSHDSVTTNLRNLISILQAAKSYYIGLKTTPTYLRAKTNAETNTRYAIVKNYKLDKIPQVYGSSPFNTGVVVEGTVYPSGLFQIVLVLELDLWRSQAPGSYDAVLASGVETFNSVNYGTVNAAGATTALSSVYVGNKSNRANLSHVFRFDDSGSSFSANITAASMPALIYPSPPAVNDIIYFGSQTSLTDSGPFSSVIFNISTAATAAMTITWEYWNGSAWTTLSVTLVDKTSGFSVSGLCSVSWEQPSAWATNAVNSITGYWVRAVITALNGNSTAPIQSSRVFYTVTWPYFEVDDDQVGGDVNPLARYKIESVGPGNQNVTRLVMGARSLARGIDFCAYWNGSDEQMALGVTFSGSVAANATHPTGVRHSGTGIAIGTDFSIASWTVSNAYSANYRGRFRVFARIAFSTLTGGDASDINLYLQVQVPSAFPSTAYITTDYVQRSIFDTRTPIVDMGEISIDEDLGDEASSNTLFVVLRAIAPDVGVAATVVVEYLILIPVDEWSCEVLSRFDDPNENSGLIASSTSYYELDGTEKKGKVSLGRSLTNDSISSRPLYNSTLSPIFLANTTQRIWFTATHQQWQTQPEKLFKVTPYAVKRYEALRGSG